MDEESEDIYNDIEDQPWFEQWKSFAIIVLDTHSSMFELDGTGSSPFKNCLKAIQKISEALLLRKNSNQLTVILNEVEEKSTLVDFKTNMIEINKYFTSIVDSNEDEIRSKFQRNQDINNDLSTIFRLCRKKFNELKQFRKKNLIFVTSDPNPLGDDSNKRHTAFNEARLFSDNQIKFELVVPNEHFNYTQFYDELFTVIGIEKKQIICKDSEGFHEMFVGRIGFKYIIQKLNFYPFIDDPSKYIEIILKTGLKSKKLLNTDKVAADGTVVKMITTPGIGKNETPEYVVKYVEPEKLFNDVVFTEEEKEEIQAKTFQKGLTLLYVSNRLSTIGGIGTPRVIFSDPGETLPFFNQFWSYCVNNDKVLICMSILRKNDEETHVELIPKLIEGNKAFLMNGILCDDEIEYDNVEMEEASTVGGQEEEEIMDKLLDNFTKDFSVRDLVSGEHERKKEFIKAKLLERDRNELDIKECVFNQEEMERNISGIEEFFA